MCSALAYVRFTPNSDRESRHPQKVMSALPPKADMCGATRDVRFGPKADISQISFDNLVGSLLEMQRHVEVKPLCRLHVDDQLEFGWILDWQIGWLGDALQDAVDVSCHFAKLFDEISAKSDQPA